MMTLRELLQKENITHIPYVEERERISHKGQTYDIFTGSFQIVNGNIKSLDGDYYSLDMMIEEYSFWEADENDSICRKGDRCLTVYVESKA